MKVSFKLSPTGCRGTSDGNTILITSQKLLDRTRPAHMLVLQYL